MQAPSCGAEDAVCPLGVSCHHAACVAADPLLGLVVVVHVSIGLLLGVPAALLHVLVLHVVLHVLLLYVLVVHVLLLHLTPG